MITVDSVLFWDEFTGVPGKPGAKKPNYNIGDKGTCKIAFHISWGFANKMLIFDATAGTITNGNALDTSSFITNGKLAIGDTVALTGSVSNNVTITITGISDRVITTSTGLTNETATNVSGAGTNKIDSIQFLYNFLLLNSQPNYTSLTDKNTQQRFINATPLDASVTTPVDFVIDTDSFAWNTNTVNASTGDTTEVTIAGAGISGNVQSFVITQTFIVTPVFLASVFTNLQNNSVPDFIQMDYYAQLNGSIGGALRVQAVTNLGSTGHGPNGLVCWFNQNNKGTRAEFYLNSMVFTDVATSTIVTAPDIVKNNLVNAQIKSRTGVFVTGDKVTVNILWGSLNEADYQNKATTWKQNMFYDRKLVTSGFASPVNGENYGTAYQELATITATIADANTMNIQFNLQLDASIAAVLKLRDLTNRNFLIWFTTQSQSITIPTQSQRVAVPYFAGALYDQNNANLMGLLGTGILSYQYPDEVTNPCDIEGLPGDPFYNRILFWVESAVTGGVTPTMKNINIQVAAVKTGKTDFILEQQDWDFTNSIFYKGAQQIVSSGTRGFITYENDPRNRVNIIRVPANDSGTKLAYEIQYGMVLRYEFWKSALTLDTISQPDIVNDIKDVNHLWSNYSGVNGWSLAFRVNFNVQGYDGFITPFTASVPMVVLKQVANANQGVIPASQNTQYFYDDGAGALTEVGSILTDALTRIRTTYTGDFSTLPNSDTLFCGSFFSDIPIIGSIFMRRFASTELSSEEDSPFSAPSGLTGATSSYSYGNVTFNIFGTNMVVIETYYDPTIFVDAGQSVNGVYIIPRLQFYKDGKLLLLSDRSPVLLSNGEGITLN